MELTTDNLIKIAIGVFVIGVVILGVFLAMRFYILPYFSGINFEEPKIDINTAFGKELLKPENKIGFFDSKGYFVDEKTKLTTMIYHKKFDKIKLQKTIGTINPNEGRFFKWIKDMKRDEEIGYIKNGQIVIEKVVSGSDVINGAYVNGNELYKIQVK